MAILVLLCLLVVHWASEVDAQSGATADSRPVLSLLNVLPYPDNRSFAGWDRGLELIPAGRLAVEQINNNPDVLPDYRLELIDIESEACGLSRVTEGLVNSYRHLVDPHSTVVGAVGLFCSSVTNVIAPILDHPKIALLEIAGSTSPIHRSSSKYPLLYHTISSSAVFNEAVIKLMENFGWKRISSFHDSLGIYFSTTASNFIEKIKANSSLELVSENPTTVSPSVVSSIFDSLVNEGGRIVYASVTVPESGLILCKAYKRGYIWPVHTYIFNERTVGDILSNETDVSCSQEELIVAMEGVFLLQYRLEPDPDTVLVSDVTYRDYRKEYLKRLSDFAEERDMNLQDDLYANVLYDEVWAFTLALTNSLERLNITLADFRFGDTETTNVIQEELTNISFQGAIGPIRFNSQREAKTTVDIFQVRNGEAIPVGVYLSNEGVLNITEVLKVPEDHFETHYRLIPEWLAIAIFTVCGLLFILTTINLLLYIIWRNKPEIKASSPYLSLLMFAGCYMLFAAVVLRTLHESIFFDDGTEFTALCTAVFWLGATGFILIIATLFVKMMRVYHVFFHFRKTSKFWSDWVLFLATLALSFGEIAILSIWTAVDTIYQDVSESYVLAKPQAYYEKHAVCSSDYMPIWLLVVFAYIGVILALAVFIAIQTRHIKKQNFKDTKKVNAFVFCSVAIAAFVLPLWYVLSSVGKEVYAHVTLTIAFLLFAVLCQIFLFVPKTVPLFWKRKRGHQNLQTQFSTSVSW